MPQTKYAQIAREGRVFLLVAALAAAAAGYFVGWWGAVPMLLLLGWLILLFRDPLREVPSHPLAVVSPVDGRIVAIEPTRNGVLDRDAIRIAIRINHLGAYIARSPVEGKLLDIPERAPTRLRRGLWLHTDEGDDVVLLIHGRGWLGRPRAFPRYGERLGQGQRFAYLRFAALAEVYVPGNSRVEVSLGEHVLAGTDVIARLIHD